MEYFILSLSKLISQSQEFITVLYSTVTFSCIDTYHVCRCMSQELTHLKKFDLNMKKEVDFGTIVTCLSQRWLPLK